MIVVPAPLEAHTLVFETELKLLSSFYPRFQIDIADGIFVPNTTIQISDLSHLCTLAKPETIFDFHLMVQDPIKHIDLLKNIRGIVLGIIFIHKTVFPPLQLLTTNYPHYFFGLVLSPEDEVNSIDSELINALLSIQIMTVSPGFQGSPFIEKSLIKIEQLRKRGYKGEILIDGAVSEKTLPIILSKLYKPDVLGVGSYLTKSPKDELERRVGYLKRAIYNL